MTEAQKLSLTLNRFDSKNILQGHVMSIIQNDVELELFSDKRHSKNRFCSFTVTAGDGQQAMKDCFCRQECTNLLVGGLRRPWTSYSSTKTFKSHALFR